MHDVRLLCIYLMFLFNCFLAGRTSGQGQQGKETKGMGNRAKLTIMTSSTNRLTCISSSSLLLPSTCSFFSSSSFRILGRSPDVNFSQVPKYGQVLQVSQDSYVQCVLVFIIPDCNFVKYSVRRIFSSSSTQFPTQLPCIKVIPVLSNLNAKLKL